MEDPVTGKVADIFYRVIAYCDTRAKDKELHNSYPDKRAVARAGVYMNAWLSHFMLFKFAPDKLGKGSPLNAFNYLLRPQQEITVLSENHRKQISENVLGKKYGPEAFIAQLLDFYRDFGIKVANPDNYTHLLSRMLSHSKAQWFDSVVALLTEGPAGWQDKLQDDAKEHDALVLWSGKKPSRPGPTLAALNAMLADAGAFHLYYATAGQVTHRAKIIDLATDQEQLDQKNWATREPYGLKADFSRYADGQKTAKIVFLAESMERVEPMDSEEFIIHGDKGWPENGNLVPLKAEPEAQVVQGEMPPKTGDSDDGKQPLNQILYGPPGTGKTFGTIERALRIIGDDIVGLSRTDIKAKFKDRLKEGRIVFTTFHQSMSYEDFIEGIKPIDPGNSGAPMSFRVVDGIFKSLCNRRPIFSVGEKLGKHEVIAVTSELLTLKKPGGSHLPLAFSMLHALMRYLEKKNIDLEDFTGTIDSKDTEKNSFPELESYLINGYDVIIPKVLKRIKAHKVDGAADERTVLIIDEINRGNVSQIFGELITLIEEDKRLGGDEELTVTLPYSKQTFGVPKHLHIIGTMNTADRSVEALDTALRRRFVFEEVPSHPALVTSIRKAKNMETHIEGIDLEQLLTVINDRIERILHRDNVIGHSFLLNCRTLEDLRAVFYKNIIPLLQEYFFGDYGKIGLVLGSGFVQAKPIATSTGFADFEHEDIDNLSARTVLHIVHYQKGGKMDITYNKKGMQSDFRIALDLLMKGTVRP
jgi:5-methylcytosine-specific restriction protein B